MERDAMSDTQIHDELGMDRPLTEAMRENRAAGDLIPFGENGLSPTSFTQVVDWAKMMSKGEGVVGPWLIGKAGACLAVIELSQRFKFSPYMFARHCFSVNGVLAVDGQGVMAIMNKWMPLALDEKGNKTRLKYVFSGEKTQYGDPEQVDNVDDRTGVIRGKIWVTKVIKPSTRKVTVSGRMLGETDILEYESPTVFNIKNKKSPVWEEDEDQQLRYWASRRWQRAHWPEGLLGIYDTEEAESMHIGFDNAKLIESEKPGVGMLERIKAARAHTSGDDRIVEGFTKDHAHNETNGFNGEVHTGGSVSAEYVEWAKSPPKADVDEAKEAIASTLEAEVSTKPKRGKKAKESPETIAERKATAADDPPATHSDATAGAVTGTVIQAKPDEPEHEVLPRNAQQWEAWCRAWIAALPAAELDKRWAEERRLRNECGVTEEVRAPLYEILLTKRDAAT
jgi:hypothetical protein